MNCKYVVLSLALISHHAIQSSETATSTATTVASSFSAGVSIGMAGGSALKNAGHLIAQETAKSTATAYTLNCIHEQINELTTLVPQQGDSIDKLASDVAKLKKGKARKARVAELETTVKRLDEIVGGKGSSHCGIADVLDGYTNKDNREIPGLVTDVAYLTQRVANFKAQGVDEKTLDTKLASYLKADTASSSYVLKADAVTMTNLKGEIRNALTAKAIAKLFADSPNDLDTLNNSLTAIAKAKLVSTILTPSNNSKDSGSDNSPSSNTGNGSKKKKKKDGSPTSTSTTVSIASTDDKKQG